MLPMPIRQWWLTLAEANAQQAMLGGRSHFRTSDRMEHLHRDQLVGQLGQIMLAWWKDGSLDAYERQRELANANPWAGDGGSDLVGGNVDVKCSLLQPGGYPEGYSLVVSPDELHRETVYVLGLLEHDLTMGYLMGWATTDRLLEVGMADRGRFEGRFVIRAEELERMMPMVWHRTEVQRVGDPHRPEETDCG